MEELLAERGIEVDHVTIYRWVQTFTPVFIDAARPARHATGRRWFVEETYVKVAGRWTYLYHARLMSTDKSSTCWCPSVETLPQHAHSSPARCGSGRLRTRSSPTAIYPRLVDEVAPAARHVLELYREQCRCDRSRPTQPGCGRGAG